MQIKAIIIYTTIGSLLATLVMQVFSLLTIKSMKNRNGVNVAAQADAVCADRSGLRYLGCGFGYVMDFGKGESKLNIDDKVAQILHRLPSENFKGTLN